MKKTHLIIIAALIISINVFAQNPTFSWVRSIGGSNEVFGTSVITDQMGNVYTTGYFSGTADFDPGAGVFNMTSGGITDIYVSKLGPTGNFIWAKRIGGSTFDYGRSIAVNSVGEVFITGNFEGTVDFDPGAGVFNLVGNSNGDAFVLKLDPSGNFVWAKATNNSTLGTVGYQLKLDPTGNIYVTGVFQNTVDFDPNVPVFNLTSNGNRDVFIWKLTGTGNFIWAKDIGGVGDDVGYAIALDGLNNVLTTGYFSGTADFDPGAGVFNMSGIGFSDVFVSKLDASGNFVWAKRIGSTGGDEGRGITTDMSGNVLATGSYSGTCDFDPNAPVFNLVSAGTMDAFVVKLDASGNLVWAKGMGGTGNDLAYGITLDQNNNVYSIGAFQFTADFDPGAGVFNLSGPASANPQYISKLDVNGNFSWAGVITGTVGVQGRAICTDANNSIYSTGRIPFGETADFDPGAGITNVTAVGPLGDAFIHKMLACSSAPLQPGSISGLSSMCSGAATTSYSIATVVGATSYTWSLPGGWSGSSSTNTISATPGTTGIFTVTANNGCGTSPQQTLAVTVNPLPTITVNSGSICAGQSFTLVPSGANTYTIQGGSAVVSPTATTSYTVVGTSTAGCVSASPATSNVSVNPTPTITVNSGSICPGQSFTITPSGASTYSFTCGSAIQTPTTSMICYVSGTSSLGCVSGSAAQSNITVYSLPIVGINSPTTICNGTNPVITAVGTASSYTWSGTCVVNPTLTAQVITAISPSCAGTYSVVGTGTNGCVNSATANIVVSPNPILAPVSSSSLLCTMPVQQSASLSAGGSGSASWVWYPGSIPGCCPVVSPSVTTTYTVMGMSALGCTSSATITQNVSTCLGISAYNSVNEEIIIYPNPTTGKFYIQIPADVTLGAVEVFNAIGSLIYKTEIENENLSAGASAKAEIEIDLGKESSGIYFVKIGTGIKKIIKE